jgi:protein-L-isoaspartate(D-aspartate) O-methyltransferase
VKRGDFIPDVIWVHRDDGWMVPLNRADDPDRWGELVDRDDPVVTQVDDGTDEHDGKGIFATSSSSAPSVVNTMLDLLDVEEGMNVLEIGTGTGCNAALLAERTGGTGRVTTIEIDPAVADHARAALGATGNPVAVVTGDGTLGHPGCAPYDRVIATASALEVPHAWVEQTRPGGRIVLILAGGFQSGTLARLTVHPDGTARGRFHGKAPFMRLRNQRDDAFGWRLWDRDGVGTTQTPLFPREPFVDFDAGFAFGALLPGWVTRSRREADGTMILMMSHAGSGSWAVITSGTDGHEVCHEGPRRLWEELAAAHRWWTGAGRPGHSRFGVTVGPEGQTFWLDAPDHVVSLPASGRLFEEPAR